MDQLTNASLPHTHYWYEVGMLKVVTYRFKRKTETNPAAMATVPLCMIVHSQVAVLPPVGAAHPMCFNILEKTARTIPTHTQSFQTFNVHPVPTK